MGGEQGAVIHEVLSLLVAGFLDPLQIPIILMDSVEALHVGADVLQVQIFCMFITRCQQPSKSENQ